MSSVPFIIGSQTSGRHETLWQCIGPDAYADVLSYWLAVTSLGSFGTMPPCHEPARNIRRAVRSEEAHSTTSKTRNFDKITLRHKDRLFGFSEIAEY